MLIPCSSSPLTGNCFWGETPVLTPSQRDGPLFICVHAWPYHCSSRIWCWSRGMTSLVTMDMLQGYKAASGPGHPYSCLWPNALASALPGPYLPVEIGWCCFAEPCVSLLLSGIQLNKANQELEIACLSQSK